MINFYEFEKLLKEGKGDNYEVDEKCTCSCKACKLNFCKNCSCKNCECKGCKCEDAKKIGLEAVREKNKKLN